jgi:hypothetical protein
MEIILRQLHESEGWLIVFANRCVRGFQTSFIVQLSVCKTDLGSLGRITRRRGIPGNIHLAT